MTTNKQAENNKPSLFDDAEEFANEIIDAFAGLHPKVLMSWNEWSDLQEMIARRWRGLSPSDLADDPLYIARARRL